MGKSSGSAKIAPHGFEESPIGIALSQNGRFIQVSQAFVEMTGSGGPGIMAMNVADLAHPEDRQADLRWFRDLVRGHRAGIRWSCASAGRMGAWVGEPERGGHSSGPESFVWLRLLETSRSARRRRNGCRCLLTTPHHHAPGRESVIITDVELAIISVNEAFLKTFGYEEREILGNTSVPSGRRVRPRPSSPAFSKTPWPAAGRENCRVAQKRAKCSPWSQYLVVRGETGKPIALVGIARDVTEQGGSRRSSPSRRSDGWPISGACDLRSACPGG